jgi:hypothetical protein
MLKTIVRTGASWTLEIGRFRAPALARSDVDQKQIAVACAGFRRAGGGGIDIAGEDLTRMPTTFCRRTLAWRLRIG